MMCQTGQDEEPKQQQWLKIVVGLGAISILLTACASFQPKPISPTETAAAFEARNLTDPGLKQFLEQNLKHEVAPWPLPSWDFPRLVLAALYYSPDLAVVRAQWEAAKSATLTAGARPNPSFNTSAQYNADAAAGISPWTLGLGLEFPIETAGKRDDRIARAQHLSEAARQRVATVAWEARSRLRAGLVNWHGARQRAEHLTRQVTLQENYVAWLERRQAGGIVPAFEITQARLALDRSRLAQHAALRQIAEARAAVAEVIGIPAPALNGMDIALNDFNHPPLTTDALSPEIRRQALQNRSDILGALAIYAAAESALQLEIAKQYPDLRLGPGYTWDQGDNKWSLGLSLVLPVFHNNQGPIAEAEARRTEAEARFVALQARVINEIERTTAGYRLVIQELEAAEALLSAAKNRLELLRDRLKTGEAQQVYLLNAQLEVESAALARAEALAKAQQAFGALEDAVHRPLDPLEFPPAAARIKTHGPRGGNS
jgi:cobalt-zinc-cadmium efflux system outer membrane protein